MVRICSILSALHHTRLPIPTGSDDLQKQKVNNSMGYDVFHNNILIVGEEISQFLKPSVVSLRYSPYCKHTDQPTLTHHICFGYH